MTVGELVKNSFVHGWSSFLRRPWFMIASVLIVFVVSAISGAVAQSASAAADPNTAFLFNAIDFLVVQMFVSMGLIAWSLRASENVEGAHLAHLWAPQRYFKFLATSIVVTIIELIGFALLVVPGIIASVLLLFAPYIVMDRNLGPVEAIQRSFAVTKRHFWSVLLFLVAALAVNIGGALLFGIGLFVTIPVSVIAIAHAYRTLSSQTA